MQEYGDFFCLLHTSINSSQWRVVLSLINYEDDEILSDLHHQFEVIVSDKSSVSRALFFGRLFKKYNRIWPTYAKGRRAGPSRYKERGLWGRGIGSLKSIKEFGPPMPVSGHSDSYIAFFPLRCAALCLVW